MNQLLSQLLSTGTLGLMVAATCIFSSVPTQACPQAASGKAAITASMTSTKAASTIVEIAEANPAFSTLVKTVEGNSINVRVTNGQVMVNNAKVTNADIQASNGVIHVINRVILPPDL